MKDLVPFTSRPAVRPVSTHAWGKRLGSGGERLPLRSVAAGQRPKRILFAIRIYASFGSLLAGSVLGVALARLFTQ